MKTDKETEKILLNLDNSEYDKLMNLKIEQEFKNELVLNKNKEEKYIENIKDIPEGKLFSKFTVFEVINKKPEITSGEEMKKVTNGNIVFKNVSFDYHTNNETKNVLRNINLNIKQGE